MKIPNKIHFAGFDYDVEVVEKLDGEDTWGRTMMGDGKIFIEKKLSNQKKYETLIHELIHIAYRHTAHSQLDSKQEEELMKPWSANVYGILKDNGFLK